jgi:hypothetical protein
MSQHIPISVDSTFYSLPVSIENDTNAHTVRTLVTLPPTYPRSRWTSDTVVEIHVSTVISPDYEWDHFVSAARTKFNSNFHHAFVLEGFAFMPHILHTELTEAEQRGFRGVSTKALCMTFAYIQHTMVTRRSAAVVLLEVSGALRRSAQDPIIGLPNLYRRRFGFETLNGSVMACPLVTLLRCCKK